MTRVLVVDDSRTARRLLEETVEKSGRYTLAGSLASAENAVVFCHSGRVDLVLMDVYTFGGENGIDAAAEIKRLFPQIRVIIVTSLPEESFLRRAREAGCESLWYKEVGEEELLNVMDRTMAGQSVYPEETPKVRIGQASSTEFTDKEKELLRTLSVSPDCKSYKDIAARMGITERTVRFHLSNIQEKTGISSLSRLTFALAQTGYIVKFKSDGEE